MSGLYRDRLSRLIKLIIRFKLNIIAEKQNSERSEESYELNQYAICQAGMPKKTGFGRSHGILPYL
jgi:hypothetical protein